MEEKKSKGIKIIVPGACPHCGKEIYVSQKMLVPTVDWVLKKEDLMKAKETVREEIEKSGIKKEDRIMALRWLDDEETLFGPDEIQTVLDQILGNKEEPKVEVAKETK